MLAACTHVSTHCLCGLHGNTLPLWSLCPHTLPLWSPRQHTDTAPVVSTSTHTAPVVSTSTHTAPVVSTSTHTAPVVSTATHTAPVVSTSTHTVPVVSMWTHTAHMTLIIYLQTSVCFCAIGGPLWAIAPQGHRASTLHTLCAIHTLFPKVTPNPRQPSYFYMRRQCRHCTTTRCSKVRRTYGTQHT